ncbi:Uncharacterised protein [Mycobacteroides abscessus subsp. abscessus]|nr:Uncharacterised protein [Mycobacteroides abscessus subsp. abscessus]
MQRQCVLDLLRVDVHAAGDDHECLAIGQIQEPVFVDVPDIARGRPRVMSGMASTAGLFVVIVIRERKFFALEVHQPGLAGG